MKEKVSNEQYSVTFRKVIEYSNTVALQWLEHLWDHENKFETGVVRATEC